MKTLVDLRIQKNKAIRQSFLSLPDKMTKEQVQALAAIQSLLKWKLWEWRWHDAEVA